MVSATTILSMYDEQIASELANESGLTETATHCSCHGILAQGITSKKLEKF
jgi:hypothetical protein